MRRHPGALDRLSVVAAGRLLALVSKRLPKDYPTAKQRSGQLRHGIARSQPHTNKHEGRHHDPHRLQVCNRDRRVNAPGLQRPARGFLRAIERQETQALPAIRDDVRHGPDQPAGSDLRSGRQTLCRGGRHWRHVDADGRPGLPDQHQCLQPVHGRVQRPRDPRAARWQEADGRRQPAEHDRQHRRQLRPDRSRLHRSARSTC